MSVSSATAREPFDVQASRGPGEELVTIRRQSPNWKIYAGAGAGLVFFVFIIYKVSSGGSPEKIPEASKDELPMTTTTTTQRTPAKSAGHLAEELNALYKAYDADDSTSPLGVTIWMRDDWSLYCNKGCYQGHADCRISTSILNHKVMLKTGNQVAVTMQRKAGVIFNETAVFSWLVKCSYMWDGTSAYRYNHGCGGTSGSTDCDDPFSAYGNVCPSTNKKCEPSDVEVLRDHWSMRGENDCPHRTTDDPCYWKGVAFSEPGWDAEGKSWMTNTRDETREMMKLRVLRQEGEDEHDAHDKKDYHNELVLDGKVLLADLHRDPLKDVSAFFYVKDADEAATDVGRGMAHAMRDTFREEYTVSEMPPLIALDHTCDVSKPNCPFLEG